MFSKIPFSKMSPEIKMEKPKFKKNIHFNREEELHVAKLIKFDNVELFFYPKKRPRIINVRILVFRIRILF